MIFSALLHAVWTRRASLQGTTRMPRHSADLRPRVDPAVPRRCRPRLEWLEDRWVPSAVRTFPGITATALPHAETPQGPATSGPVSLGFSLNFLGKTYDRLWVNATGNVTFNAGPPGHNTNPLQDTNRAWIVPFHGYVDLTAPGGGEVTYAKTTVDGRQAFEVTWDGVGYYKQHADKTNRFQLVLINRSDIAPGDFDIEFNYDR